MTHTAMLPFFAVVVEICFVILFVSLVLTAIRVYRGPSHPDRVVALDLFGLLGVSVIALFSIYVDRPVFLDAAIALALVAFFGTIAYARFLEKRTDLPPETDKADQGDESGKDEKSGEEGSKS